MDANLDMLIECVESDLRVEGKSLALLNKSEIAYLRTAGYQVELCNLSICGTEPIKLCTVSRKQQDATANKQ